MWATSAETTSTVHPLSQQQSRHEVSTAVYIYHRIYLTFLIMYWYIPSNRVRLLCLRRVYQWLCHSCILSISRRYLSLILLYLPSFSIMLLLWLIFHHRMHQLLIFLVQLLFQRQWILLQLRLHSPVPWTRCWFQKLYVHFHRNNL